MTTSSELVTWFTMLLSGSWLRIINTQDKSIRPTFSPCPRCLRLALHKSFEPQYMSSIMCLVSPYLQALSACLSNVLFICVYSTVKDPVEFRLQKPATVFCQT